MIGQIPFALRNMLRAIAIDATSATVLLCDAAGEALRPPLPYNDTRATAEAAMLARLAPDSPATAPASGLAKLLWFQRQPEIEHARHFLHQADWLAFLLEGIARIEAQGYRLLQELGATPLTAVLSAGGGAHNAAFAAIRARLLGVPVRAASHAEAAYGSALLARDGARLLYSHHAR